MMNNEQPLRASCPQNEQLLNCAEENIDHRRSRWHSSLAGLKYLSQSYGDHEIKTRNTDRITNILFALAIFSTSIWVVLGQRSASLALICDVFSGVTLVFYLANRLGILTMLTRRQAVLIAELFAGFIVFGIYLSANFIAMSCWVNNMLQIAH